MVEKSDEDWFDKQYNNPSEELEALMKIVELLTKQAGQHPERKYDIDRAQTRIDEILKQRENEQS